MSDVSCQYVSVDVTGSTSSATASGFAQVDPLATMILPAGSRHDTAGVGRVSGTVQPPWLFHHLSAEMASDGASILFQRDKGTDPASITVRGAVQLLTYKGPAGGPNEIIRRAFMLVTIPSGTASVDSGPITGVTDFNQCVPIALCRTNRSSKAMGETMVRVQRVVVSGTNRIRLSRAIASGDIVAALSVYELGPAWVVRQVDHTFTAADTDENDTITAVSVPAFVMRTGTTGGGGSNNGPAQGTQFAYLSSSTNLRSRLEETAGTKTMTAFVIGNAQLAVQKLGTPAGSYPLTQVTSPQAENITVTTLPSLATSAFVFQAGSNIDNFNNCPGGTWGGRFTTTTNFEARRGDSVGASDYVLFAIDLSGLNSGPQVDDVSAIVDGGTFNITGTGLKPGGTAATVKMGGRTCTVNTSSDSLLNVTPNVNRYGDDILTVTTGGGTETVPVFVAPPSGWGFVNIVQLLPAAQRITASPVDVAVGHQVAWTPVTGATIAADGSATILDSSLPDEIEQFTCKVNDGSGYGTSADNDRLDPIVVPSLVGTLPGEFRFQVGVAVQFNFAQYAQGFTAVRLVDPANTSTETFPPSGITAIGIGIYGGTATAASDVTHKVDFSNSAGHTFSATFHLIFEAPVAEPVIKRRNVITTPRLRRPFSVR